MLQRKIYRVWRSMKMLSDEIKNVPIEEAKLNAMKRLIIQTEKENLKTNEKSSQDMIKIVRKIIEKEC